MQNLVQFDFDGTITEEDEAFRLLDAFACGDWRKVLEEYRAGKITVGDFNSRAFALVTTGRERMVDLVKRQSKIRPGFKEVITRCGDVGFKPVIVSNGLDFYIEAILEKAGVTGVDVFAARTRFGASSLDVRYIGPDGMQLQDGFKETYTKSFLSSGYSVVYVGNGPSDFPSARIAHRVFATGDLFNICRDNNVECTRFTDLFDVAEGLGI